MEVNNSPEIPDRRRHKIFPASLQYSITMTYAVGAILLQAVNLPNLQPQMDYVKKIHVSDCRIWDPKHTRD